MFLPRDRSALKTSASLGITLTQGTLENLIRKKKKKKGTVMPFILSFCLTCTELVTHFLLDLPTRHTFP